MFEFGVKKRNPVQIVPADIHAETHDGTPLHLSTRDLNVIRTTKLLEQGAKVNAVDNLGMTPLHWASLKGHVELIRLLLFYGADVNARDSFFGGATPVGVAKLLNFSDIAEEMENWAY